MLCLQFHSLSSFDEISVFGLYCLHQCQFSLKERQCSGTHFMVMAQPPCKFVQGISPGREAVAVVVVGGGAGVSSEVYQYLVAESNTVVG